MNVQANRRTRQFTGVRVLVDTPVRCYFILFAPVEILVTEKENGQGTDIVYVLPSSLILVEENPRLRTAAEALDAKLASLVASSACP